MSPDGSKRLPPEERLLRLIRGKPASHPALEATSSVRPFDAASLAAASPPDLAERLRRLGWSRLAIGLLAAVLAAEVLWLLLLTVVPVPMVSVPAAPTARGQAPEPGAAAPEIPSIAESAARPLFAASAPAAGASAQAIPSGSARLLASRLTLMGIVAGEPAQAIIEDAQTKKTYFVTTGQPVVDGAVLERVLENGVILDYLGEKIELML